MNKENNRIMTETAMECQVAPQLGGGDLDRNNNSNSGNVRNGKNYEKYSLRPRSIQNRIETEKRRKEETKKKPKPKHKPPPLSKYRRKTANARERDRMREINTAFECLQRSVPQYPILPVNAQGKTCEKLTKITTLRLAMNYIEALRNLLNPPVVDHTATTSTSKTGKTRSSTDESSGFSTSTSSSSGNLSCSASDFSPASSYTMSPLSLSSCSPLPPVPDCIQTVMRSVVSPASAAATAAAAASLGLNSTLLQLQQTNNNNLLPHNININNNINAPHLHSNGQSQINLQLNNAMQMHQSLNSSFSPPPSMTLSLSLSAASPSSSLSSICSSTTSSSSCSPKMKTKLPPLSSSLSSALLRKSMSSFIADCTQMSRGCGINNNSNNCSGSAGHRAGSLSSLTESDLSEYASDLLSDEGSTLDDPMFDDLIGVGVATDLDLLLESDGDSLHFSSDLSDT